MKDRRGKLDVKKRERKKKSGMAPTFHTRIETEEKRNNNFE